MLSLRPYQRDMLDAIVAAKDRGITRQVVSAPTGSGKTVVIAHLVAQQRAQGRVIILCHRDELLTQTRAKLLALMPDAQIGLVKAESNETQAPIVLASVQTLAVTSRREQLAQEWALIIGDEIHHASPGNTWEQSLIWLGALTGTLTVGFTATPYRANGAPMVMGDSFFQEVVYHKHLLEMIEAGYLVMPRAIRLALKDFTLKGMRKVAGEYSASALEDSMMAVQAPYHLARALCEHATGRRTISFSPGVLMAEALTACCTTQGLRAATIIGSTPTEEREAAYQAMRAGELDVLSSVNVLSEGFDLPAADTALIARATTSRVLYQQTIGRVLRLSPETGKTEALVLDATGATERNNLFSMAEMLGLIPQKELVPEGDEEDDVLAVASEDEEDEREEGQQEALLLELFAKQTALLRQSTFSWVTTQRKAFVLSLPDNVLLRVQPLAADKAVLQLKRDRAWKVLAANIPMPHAFGIAEDTARSMGFQRFANKDAAWLARTASEKQQQFARKLGIDPAQHPTMGELSRAITAITGDW